MLKLPLCLSLSPSPALFCLRRVIFHGMFCYPAFLAAPLQYPAPSSGAAAATVENPLPPLAGFGMGLPLSRVYARYFGGDVLLKSMEGFGMDRCVGLSCVSVRLCVLKGRVRFSFFVVRGYTDRTSRGPTDKTDRHSFSRPPVPCPAPNVSCPRHAHRVLAAISTSTGWATTARSYRLWLATRVSNCKHCCSLATP